MPKGTIVLEIQCAVCGSAILEVPDDTSDDPLILCANKHVVGPYSSLKSTLQRDAHTHINAVVTDVTVKPVD